MGSILKRQLNSALVRAHNELIGFVSEINDTFDAQDARIDNLELNSGTGFFYLDNDGDLCQFIQEQEENTNE